MNWSIIIAGLSLGAVSSFHCVGMCGALAFALPVQHLGRWQRLASIGLYHLGRVVSYTLLGAFFGLLGRQVYLAGFQRSFSIAIGVLMVVYFVAGLLPGKRRLPEAGKAFWVVQRWMGYFLKQGSVASFLFLGMANGLLPCGMVYLAIAGAASIAAVSDGMIFMASFGSGTLPAMIALSSFGMIAGMGLRNRMRRLSPFIMLFMGVLLILRGLNLGIPFISPVLESNRPPAISCH